MLLLSDNLKKAFPHSLKAGIGYQQDLNAYLAFVQDYAARGRTPGGLSVE